jgi:hypothetical protein
LGVVTTYEFWRHRTTGEVFAVKLLDGIVVASCGPLHRDDVDAGFLPTLDYTEKDAGAIESAREAYAPLATD